MFYFLLFSFLLFIYVLLPFYFLPFFWLLSCSSFYLRFICFVFKAGCSSGFPFPLRRLSHTATWCKFFLREEYCCFHPRHAAAPVIRFWYYKSGFPKMQYLCFVPPETKIQCIFLRRSLSSSSFKGSVASCTA